MQFVYGFLDERRDIVVVDADDDVVAMVEGNKYPSGIALCNGQRHGWRDFAVHGIRDDNGQRSDNDIRLAAADNDGIFTGRRVGGSRLQHDGGRRSVRADSRYVHVGK